MVEAIVLWNEPNNLSHWNFHLDPGWTRFAEMVRLAASAIRKVNDMVAAGYSPSVRLFEASACGAAILSDAWPGIENFLTPGEEVLLPADAVQTASILQYLPDAERRRIGQRARDRILSEHTSEHRAIEFEQIVSGCAASPNAPANLQASGDTSPAALPGAPRS